MLYRCRPAWVLAIEVGLAALVVPVAQARDVVAPFDIAAGPAARTLPLFATQAGLTILASAEDLAGIATPALQATLAPSAALALLLRGTGLVAKIRDNGSIIVTRNDNSAPHPTEHRPHASGVPKVVVATRRSQQSAIEQKKNAATAMDSVVAENVGTLPDRNIGEAISRIAGVALNRGEFGEGTNVSIRGNGSELTRVELDGQEVRSAGGSDMNGGGDGRATEFRQLPADLIKSVDVVKGATADMTEGSLGGSILIKTRTSLDFDRPYTSLRTAATQNSLNREWNQDANLIVARKFLDGRLGLLINASAITLANESHQFQVSANGRDGYMRAIDFDNSPEKTFSYQPHTVDLSNPASTTPWATYGSWSAATPLEIVTKSAAAQTKQDCYTAFPTLTAASPALASLSAANRSSAITARNQELASCLNQWNDINPALLRYFVKRQDDARKNLDLRTDFKLDNELTLHAKASYSKREVDDHLMAYSLGNVTVNGSASRYTDADGVRNATPGSGYYTFPYAYSSVAGQPLLSGAVANIDPASVVVDANHHVTQFTLPNANVSTDQIRNHMGTTSRYLQLGASYQDGPLSATMLLGDARSRFWRADARTSWSYVYGSTTVSLQPNGTWAYSMPAGTNLSDWARIAALQPAASAGAPQYTLATPAITYIPQMRETGERSAKADLSYALPDAIPFFKRIKAGFNLRDNRSDHWGEGGYTVAPGVTVPSNRISSSLVGCESGAGATPCAYGINTIAASRNYQIVLTQQQFLDAVQSAMTTSATPTSFFYGASDRPAALVGNWTAIDVDKLFQLIGAPNLNFNCIKTCNGSDGLVYEQPRTSFAERTLAGYLMADFGMDLPWGLELEGNAGYRYVRTRVQGTGNMTFISRLKTAQFDPANPGAAEGTITTQVQRNTTFRASTTDFLPIYNLALWLAPDKLVLRYSRAKAVARPGASQLVPSGTCIYDEAALDDNGQPLQHMLCTTMGNPALRAQTNINHNLSLEWYPNRDTLFSASAYRQIGRIGAPLVDNVNGVKVFAGTEVVDPASGQPLKDVSFDLRTYLNGPPASRTGIELSSKTAFTFLPWKLRHTGVDANVSRQRSNQTRAVWDLLTGAVLPQSGEPRYALNWALWYDDGAWQARLAVQTVGARYGCIAPCGDSINGYSLAVYPNTGLGYTNPAYNPGSPVYNDRTSYVDGKLAYRWKNGVEIFIEGRNLTNQTQKVSMASAPYADGTPNLQTLYYPGRRITIGLSVRRY